MRSFVGSSCVRAILMFNKVMDGQCTTWRRNIAENFNRLSRVHERYRRQTDDRRQTDRQTDGPSMTYSEHELEFTFAKNQMRVKSLASLQAFCIIAILGE